MSTTPIFIDCETDGVGEIRKGEHGIIQISWNVGDKYRNFYICECDYINPFAYSVHHITVEHLKKHGHVFNDAISVLINDLRETPNPCLVAHNIQFDYAAILYNMHKHSCCCKDVEFMACIPTFCTMKNSTDFCMLKGVYGNSFKWPKLTELRAQLNLESVEQRHDALHDVILLREAYEAGCERGVFCI